MADEVNFMPTISQVLKNQEQYNQTNKSHNYKEQQLYVHEFRLSSFKGPQVFCITIKFSMS